MCLITQMRIYCHIYVRMYKTAWKCIYTIDMLMLKTVCYVHRFFIRFLFIRNGIKIYIYIPSFGPKNKIVCYMQYTYMHLPKGKSKRLKALEIINVDINVVENA